MQTVHWGIVGPGKIAHRFAKALRCVDGAVLTAVGSRAESRARDFAEIFDVPHTFGSYTELAASTDVDAVYIATPHPHHVAPARDCLKHGKAVLCEKPFTVNARELQSLINLSRAKNILLMEGMWTRFLPIMKVVREWIDDGRIGKPRIVQADFGYRGGWNPESRMLNPSLAGGSLLDVGVYPISFSHWVFGDKPRSISGQAAIGKTNVDEQMCATLKFAEGQLASVMSAVRTATTGMATIFGTEGKIQLGPRFWQATSATLIRGEKSKNEERPFCENGFEFEIIEFCRCLRDGLTECPTMTLQDSLYVMQTLDTLRQQWGLRYPFE